MTTVYLNSSDAQRICRDVEDLEWGPVPGTEVAAWTVLRRSPSGDWISAIARLGPSFAAIHSLGGSLPTLIYVQDGVLEVDGRPVGRGTMVAICPGADDGVSEVALASGRGATVVLIRRPGPGACPGLENTGASVTIATTADVPVVPSIVNGKATGIERRVLWLDSEHGGDVRVLGVPPGFVGAGRGYHPCGEEILCLDGEITADQEHQLTAGWYLYNPAGYVHGGNEFSERGALLLEWHDGPWDLVLADS